MAAVLADLCRQPETTMRQRLREFSLDREDKRGTKRQELAVEACFAPLLRWILTWWAPDEQRLALALDATTLRDTFPILSVHVVYRGWAIPIAWMVVEATRQGSWKPHGGRLLNRVRGVIPPEWMVVVRTDRGLYARWLSRNIRQVGWHP